VELKAKGTLTFSLCPELRPGSLLRNANAAGQNMVIRKLAGIPDGNFLRLVPRLKFEPSVEAEYVFEAYCVNFHKDNPSASDSLVLVSAAGEGTDSDDPAAMLMRRLIDSFAEYERLIIGARTRAALSAKRRRGERISRFAPFGFVIAVDGRTLEPCVVEQRTLRTIQEQRAAGQSLQAIADGLNSSGERTRAGSPWRFEYVRSALRQVA
jgi:hypothetical protein